MRTSSLFKLELAKHLVHSYLPCHGIPCCEHIVAIPEATSSTPFLNYPPDHAKLQSTATAYGGLPWQCTAYDGARRPQRPAAYWYYEGPHRAASAAYYSSAYNGLRPSTTRRPGPTA